MQSPLVHHLLRISVVLAACNVTPRAIAQDWTQWRGPARDGAVAGFHAPAAWPKSLTRSWQVDVGVGHATPLVAGGRVYVFARANGQEVVRCLDLTDGAEIWRQQYDAPYEVDPAAVEHGPGPKSTPLLDFGRLYTLGISGILTCWDAESGKRVWRQDMAATFPKSAPQFGTAMSPLLHDGLLITDLGGVDGGVLAAFDAASGKARWRWPHDDGPAYASPIIVELNGLSQLVTQTRSACVAIAPTTGKPLWTLPFTTDYEQNSVSPVAWNDLLIFGGYQKPTFGVRVERAGKKRAAKEVWSNPELPMYMSTPVAIGDRLYGMSQRDSGKLFALDPATGEAVWTGEGRLGDNAALLVADGLLVVLTTNAELIVYRPGDDGGLGELARYTVAESPTWAHPVLHGDRILVKDAESVIAWSLVAR